MSTKTKQQPEATQQEQPQVKSFHQRVQEAVAPILETMDRENEAIILCVISQNPDGKKHRGVKVMGGTGGNIMECISDLLNDEDSGDLINHVVSIKQVQRLLSKLSS